MNPIPQTGAIPSPIDYRDDVARALFSSAAISITLPTKFHTDLGSVLMQGQEPDCVLFSVIELMRLHFFKKTGQWIDLSPRFLAILIKRYDGQDPATGGTFPRLAMKLATEFGCCTTALLPNDTTLPVLKYRENDLLTPAMFAEAAKYKIPGYVSVPTDYQNTRAAIYLYGAVSGLFLIGNELWTPSWADIDIDPLRTPKTIVSGHQMTPNGWTDPTLNNLRNHWSAAWANNGESQYDPLAWSPFIKEQWAIAEIPADTASFLKDLPKATDFHYRWNVNLSQGQSSEDIKFAQIALMILGFLAPVDPSELGIYGPKTAAAVFAYQHARGIQPSANNIGPLTRAALNAQFAI